MVVTPVVMLLFVYSLIGNEGQAWPTGSDAARMVLMVVGLAQAAVLVLCSVVLFKTWVKRMHDRGIGGPVRLGGRVLVLVVPYTFLVWSPTCIHRCAIVSAQAARSCGPRRRFHHDGTCGSEAAGHSTNV